MAIHLIEVGLEHRADQKQWSFAVVLNARSDNGHGNPSGLQAPYRIVHAWKIRTVPPAPEDYPIEFPSLDHWAENIADYRSATLGTLSGQSRAAAGGCRLHDVHLRKPE